MPETDWVRGLNKPHRHRRTASSVKNLFQKRFLGNLLCSKEGNRFDYLEAVISAKKNVLKYPILELSCNEELREDYEDEIIALKKQLDRYKSFWYVMNSMLTLYESGISIGMYLNGKGYNKIAIYGMGMIGKHLAIKLKKEGQHISFGIDQNRNQINNDFPIISMQDEKREADLIIVTVCYDYIKIKKELMKKYDCEIISLKTILDELTV